MINQQFKIDGPPWLIKDGDDKDVVLSTKIRYFRNLAGFPFPQRALGFELKKIEDILANMVNKILPPHYQFDLINLDNFEKEFLRERHILNSNENLTRNAMIFVSHNEDDYIIINGEDHLQIAFFSSGFNPFSLYEKAYHSISLLDNTLEYAKNPQWGYLSSSPVNIGSAMRLSTVIHLWGITLLGRLNKLESILNPNLGVRGFFSEGLDVIGYVFQILTTRSLGITEQGIIDISNDSILKIIQEERNARIELIDNAGIQLVDRISRALGILRNSRLLGVNETLNLLSTIKIGFDADYLTGDIQKVYQLFTLIQPSHIESYFGTDKNDPVALDTMRADIVNEYLHEIDFKE